MLGSTFVRAQLVLFAVVIASSIVVALEARVDDHACAVASCADREVAEESSDECPPGCDDGCACCVRARALPTAVEPALLVLQSRRVEYWTGIDRVPPAPEPRGRDVVPRPLAFLL